MRAAILGVRLQARLMRSDWSALLIVLTVPLSTAVFLAIMLHAGRTDLVSHAVLAPALMALWAMVLLVSAEIVESERTSGTLEQLVASPASVPAFFAGRIALVTGFSFVPLVESWTTAAMCGYPLAVRSPLVFGVVLTLTALAVIGWAGVAAAGFVLVRAVRPLQNTLMFPVYLLSGVLVPAALLPAVLRPLSALVFLRWSADLLRDAIRLETVPALSTRLLMLSGLGVAGALLAGVLTNAVMRRLRFTARLGES